MSLTAVSESLLVARADDGEAQTLAAAAYAEAVGGLQRDPEPGDICEFLLQLGLDLLLRALAVGPGRQRCDDPCAVDAAVADRAQHVGDLAGLLVGCQDVLDLLGQLRHVVEIAALLRGQADLDDAAILRRRDFLFERLECEPAERTKSEAQQRRPASEASGRSRRCPCRDCDKRVPKRPISP